MDAEISHVTFQLQMDDKLMKIAVGSERVINTYPTVSILNQNTFAFITFSTSIHCGYTCTIHYILNILYTYHTCLLHMYALVQVASNDFVLEIAFVEGFRHTIIFALQ